MYPINIVYDGDIYDVIIYAVVFNAAACPSCDMKKKSSDLAVRVGKAISLLRLERKGRSQEAFAIDCGIGRSYMGIIERGEASMTIDMAETIASGLDMTLGEFFTAVLEQKNVAN